MCQPSLVSTALLLGNRKSRQHFQSRKSLKVKGGGWDCFTEVVYARNCQPPFVKRLLGSPFNNDVTFFGRSLIVNFGGFGTIWGFNGPLILRHYLIRLDVMQNKHYCCMVLHGI